MIVTVDQDRKIVEFNNAACETFGYRKEEVAGKNIKILYAREEQSKKVSTHISKNGRFIGEIENIRKNGEVFTSFLSATVMRDENGNVIGTVGNSRDITRDKHLEELVRKKEHRYRLLLWQLWLSSIP